jgi:hypothetical protein
MVRRASSHEPPQQALRPDRIEMARKGQRANGPTGQRGGGWLALEIGNRLDLDIF